MINTTLCDTNLCDTNLCYSPNEIGSNDSISVFYPNYVNISKITVAFGNIVAMTDALHH